VGVREGGGETALDTDLVVWAFSAHTRSALQARAADLAELAEQAGTDLADVAHALDATVGSSAQRAVVLADDPAALAARLRALASGAEPPDDGYVVTGRAVRGRVVGGPGPVWVFSGQGGQWVGMAAGLLSVSPVFAEAFEEAAGALRPLVDWDPVGLLTGTDEAWMERTEMVQPLLWAVMVALARWWRAAGVRPAAVVGHSQGEVAAAVVAGALTLADGARVVVARSRLVARSEGAMALLSGPAERLRGWLEAYPQVSLAARNSPGEVIVSGPVGVVAAVVEAVCAGGGW